MFPQLSSRCLSYHLLWMLSSPVHLHSSSVCVQNSKVTLLEYCHAHHVTSILTELKSVHSWNSFLLIKGISPQIPVGVEPAVSLLPRLLHHTALQGTYCSIQLGFQFQWYMLVVFNTWNVTPHCFSAIQFGLHLTFKHSVFCNPTWTDH